MQGDRCVQLLCVRVPFLLMLFHELEVYYVKHGLSWDCVNLLNKYISDVSKTTAGWKALVSFDTLSAPFLHPAYLQNSRKMMVLVNIHWTIYEELESSQ